MIRMIQSSSAGHAKAYFSDALSKSDYYLDDQELNGRFQGRIAERLGLKGLATKETFFALCENVHPKTGEPLTPRTREDRTTGYDINFHCPKSVSILHALANDNHLMEAFEESVSETMHDIQDDAKTRVRKSGQYKDRDTNELLWADFVHQTARPVEGSKPDPHLHCHCFVFNVTWDETEQTFKAGQFRDIKRDMPYYQARFHKRLSDRLMDLGYQIRKTDTSFEIEGVPKAAIELFSKRTDEIGRTAKEKGITDAKQLSELGARTRSKKQKGMSMTELKAEWKEQIHALGIDADKEGNNIIRYSAVQEKSNVDVTQCIDYALLHSFERASVMVDRRLLESAYRFSLGSRDASVDKISEHFKKDSRIIHINDGARVVCTTREVLTEEKRMVDLAREGQGKLIPLYKEAPELSLLGQQAEAVKHVLTTSHRVSIIRGAAGTGKTTLMREAISFMEKAGKKVAVVAPTAQAARGVLKDEEHYENAETVAKLLIDKKLQQELKGQILWVDEAGLLGTKDMKDILEVATQMNAQVILGGDTRQHASVVRGDALRILNTVAGIKTAEVSKIYRQQNVQYREAVEELSKGNIKDGFEKLDTIGSIKTIDPMNPNAQLVDDYVDAIKKGKSSLIISPTHKQGEEVTNDVRKKLREAGLIGKKEITISRLSNLNLTEAQKSDWRNFQEGQIIKFNQNAPGFKRGSVWNVESVEKQKISLKNENGELKILPTLKSGAYDIHKPGNLKLSKGDRVRITRNGYDANKKRLNNGQTLEVVSVSKKGNVVLRNEKSKVTYSLDQRYGHVAHAHCITSYASQGKNIQEVFISQPAATFPATDAKQFYVSVSRGRQCAHIYTDNKEVLLEHARELGNRESALETLGRLNTIHEHVLQIQQLKKLQTTKNRNFKKIVKTKEQDHER